MPRIKVLSEFDGYPVGTVVDLRLGYAEARVNQGDAVWEFATSRPRLISYVTEDGIAVKLVSFILVRSGSDWAFLSNHPNHATSPAAAAGGTITQDANSIVVPFGFTFSTILGSSLTEDDVLARAGVQCGASVGFSAATMYFANAGVDLNPNHASMGNGNVFFSVWGLE